MPSKNQSLHMPKLTIAIGVYNDSRFLRGCLDAILSQTYTDFEVVISDNASTDISLQIIQEYAAKDSRIRLFHQPENVGLANNYNFLRQQARGEYFMWAACDDRCAPEYVRTILDGMEVNPEIVLGFTPYQYIDENGQSFGDIRKFDFSGRNAFIRLMKFFFFYDDCMVYGIYRLNIIENLDFPIWWGKNAHTPLNIGYPFLAFVLAAGNFQLYGDQPLWGNCIKSAYHYQPFKENSKAILFLFYFLVRKINVVWVQFKYIWKGSGSFLLSMVLIPILLFRILVDTLILARNVFLKAIKNRSRISQNQ